MNIDTISRTRIAAAATLAAGAVLAGALGSAAPANAATDYWVGLAYSFDSGIAGKSFGVTIEDQARILALQKCQDSGGNHCVWFGSFKNECAAMSILGDREWHTAAASTVAAAEQLALQQNPGSHIAVSGCSGPSPFKPPRDVLNLPTITAQP